MRMQLHIYRCGNGHNFTAPVAGGTYGTFLLHSRVAGNIAFVEAYADPAFDEVRRVLRDSADFMALDVYEQSDLVQTFFGLTCDPDPTGSPYSITDGPCCSRCGGCDTRFLRETHPPEFVDVDVPFVSHERWDALTETQRRQTIEQALGAYLRGRR